MKKPKGTVLVSRPPEKRWSDEDQPTLDDLLSLGDEELDELLASLLAKKPKKD